MDEREKASTTLCGGKQMTRAIEGRLLQSGEAVRIELRAGRVASVTPLQGSPEGLPWLAPGLADIQVNGSAGYDLNGDDPSPETVAGLIAYLRSQGVLWCCPTVVTASLEAMEARLHAISEACNRFREVSDAVLGIHLEGPFISPEDGPRGAHPLEQVRDASREVFDRLNRAAGGRIAILTLAPEAPGAIELIAGLSEALPVVALGHTGASRPVIRQAVLAGASLSTHLGNGAHAMLPRHDNYLWEQLAADELWASFIPDGHHLPAPVLKAMVRAKGVERSILTSDAVFVAGLPPGEYQFAGHAVDLTEAGRVNLAGTPYLAGSGLSLPEGVFRCRAMTGLPLPECWRMASANPRRLLRALPVGDRITPCVPASSIVAFESTPTGFRWVDLGLRSDGAM